jgi:hypothetical protein
MKKSVSQLFLCFVSLVECSCSPCAQVPVLVLCLFLIVRCCWFFYWVRFASLTSSFQWFCSLWVALFSFVFAVQKSKLVAPCGSSFWLAPRSIFLPLDYFSRALDLLSGRFLVLIFESRTGDHGQSASTPIVPARSQTPISFSLLPRWIYTAAFLIRS